MSDQEVWRVVMIDGAERAVTVERFDTEIGPWFRVKPGDASGQLDLVNNSARHAVLKACWLELWDVAEIRGPGEKTTSEREVDADGKRR